MKLVSYNINGVRSAYKKGLIEWIENSDIDIFCFQEVRANEEVCQSIFGGGQLNFFSEQKSKFDDYFKIYNCGKVPGYAGTMILSSEEPKKVLYDMGDLWKDNEGRTTTAFFEDFVVVNAYIPNGSNRLDFKMAYLDALTKHLERLKKENTVICVGDFNIAHNEIDLTHPKQCASKSVFLPIERKAFEKILNLGFLDVFRTLYPEKREYSWRSYSSRLPEEMQKYTKNFYKYRIDYCIISNDKRYILKDCQMPDLPYSDHLPVISLFQKKIKNK